MTIEVYDIECLSNLFTYTGYNITEDKWYVFVISKWINQYQELCEHLDYLHDNNSYMVGYNNLQYDYPVLHHLITSQRYYQDNNGQDIAIFTYKKSQEIIESFFSAIPFNEVYIKQLDLFKIWHFDSRAKLTSLKSLEFAMNLENIEDMPIHHTKWCNEEDVPIILDYNKNDVYATYKFLLITFGKTDNPLYKGKDKISLRQKISKRFNVNCMNFSDIKMGERLLLHLYSRSIGSSPKEIKELSTIREEVYLSDCIPFWAERIKSKEFLNILEAFKNKKIYASDTNPFEISTIYNNTEIFFGLGGIHASIQPGIYCSDDEYIIVDWDVASLYPSISKRLGLFPEHLGKKFNQLYSSFVDERLEEKTKDKSIRDNNLIETYKLMLNGGYGKSGHKESFLYDLLYKYKTTIAGQLFFCIWLEKLSSICDYTLLQCNTDGVTIKVKRKYLNDLRKANQELTDYTSLIIEECTYSKLIIRDVNNYMAVYSDSTSENEHIKYKGCFEIDKEYHKDNSMRIVPIAIKNYFIYNIPIKETIYKHDNIYDFCIRLKLTGKTKGYFRCFDGEQYHTKELGNTTRYFISYNGGVITKKMDSGRIVTVNDGFGMTLFNKYYDVENFKDYKINYNFYMVESTKIISVIEESANQLTLF